MRRLAVIVAVILGATASAFAQPSITFKGNQVIAKGITAGGRVACYGVAHDFVDTYPGIYRWGREAVDTDGDGVATIELPREVPTRSLWVCADVVTGQLVLQTPAPTSLNEVPLRGRGALLGANGNDLLNVASDRVDLVLIRPGQGAWLLLTGDGGDTDDDKLANGSVNARPEAFQGIGAVETVTASLRSGATLIAIYPLTLEYSVAPLGKR
jgi:hypothetical protein